MQVRITKRWRTVRARSLSPSMAARATPLSCGSGRRPAASCMSTARSVARADSSDPTGRPSSARSCPTWAATWELLSNPTALHVGRPPQRQCLTRTLEPLTRTPRVASQQVGAFGGPSPGGRGRVPVAPSPTPNPTSLERTYCTSRATTRRYPTGCTSSRPCSRSAC